MDRNEFLKLLCVKDTIKPLRFEGTQPFTLKTDNTSKNWDGIIEYSTDNTSWVIWNGEETPSSSVLYLRGTDNTYITGDYDKYWVCNTSGLMSVIGRIDYLLDYQTVLTGGTPSMGVDCYRELFIGWVTLIAAPELPATTLTVGCYSHMFAGCHSLRILPELPATTLAARCYDYMFAFSNGPKVSASKTGNYTKPWRIPSTGTITNTAANWNQSLLYETGGTFTGDPQPNTTYYLDITQ